MNTKKNIDLPLWRAAIYGVQYYSINTKGNIDANNDAGIMRDEERYDFGNYFEEEEEAEKYADLIKFVLTKRLLTNPIFTAMIENLKEESK